MNDGPMEFHRELQKESALATIRYEIRMLRYTFDWLAAHGPNHQPKDEMRAILESYLLHYRTLVNFLSARGVRHRELRINQPRQWAESPFTETSIIEVQNLARPVQMEHSSAISKFLAHAMKARHQEGRS